MTIDWMYCPLCGSKTRVRIREDTELKNFPLYCPKCRNETLIELKQGKINIIHESQTLRRRADDRQSMTAIIGSFSLRRVFVYENDCTKKGKAA